jgi:hypothetical protein
MLIRLFLSRLLLTTAIVTCFGACKRQTVQEGHIERHEEKRADPQPKKSTFDPRITVEWPAIPSEKTDASSDPKSYSAIAILRRDRDFATFNLMVNEFTEDDIKKHTVKGLIEATALPGSDSEIGRKAIEVSPKKYPGLQITKRIKGAKGRTLFTREMVFIAGTKLVALSAGGPDETFINGPEVDAFFDSLKIRE